MKKNHVRLDDLLVLKGLATSKSLAKSIIMSGKVLVEEKIQDKPGHYFSCLLYTSPSPRDRG